MITQPIFAAAAGGVVALLALCALIGLVLSWRVKTPAARDTVVNLNARIRSWWGIVAVFGAAPVFGRIVTLVLFAILSFLALREFMSLTPTRRGDVTGGYLGSAHGAEEGACPRKPFYRRPIVWSRCWAGGGSHRARRPGGPIWRNREDHILSLLSPGELAVWHAERDRAEAEGLLFMAHPLHCAVGTKPGPASG